MTKQGKANWLLDIDAAGKDCLNRKSASVWVSRGTWNLFPSRSVSYVSSMETMLIFVKER